MSSEIRIFRDTVLIMYTECMCISYNAAIKNFIWEEKRQWGKMFLVLDSGRDGCIQTSHQPGEAAYVGS